MKPQGYFFHNTIYKQIQYLLNWFKENFKTRDYLKEMKRQRSPRAKVPEIAQQQMQQQMEQRTSNQEKGAAWGGISENWANRGGASVHSLNNDGDDHYNRPPPV